MALSLAIVRISVVVARKKATLHQVVVRADRLFRSEVVVGRILHAQVRPAAREDRTTTSPKESDGALDRWRDRPRVSSRHILELEPPLFLR